MINISLTHSNSESIINGQIFDYDKLGNKVKVEKINPNADKSVTDFTYDSLGRIKDVVVDDNKVRTYSYDSFGNRSSLTEGNNTINYEYNLANQLVKKESQDDVIKYNYDKRGNLIEVVNNNSILNSYEFGVINKMTKAVDANGRSANYSYNGIGFRVGKNTIENDNPSSQIDYLLDQTKQYSNLISIEESNISHASSKASTSKEFIWDENPLFMTDEGILYGLVHDELGSTVAMTSDSGNVIDAFDYDEFGIPSKSNDYMIQSFGFTGYLHDDVSNTSFAQAREYLPDIGRFAGRDIIKGFQDEPITLNEYTYCLNSPKKYVDRDGEKVKGYLSKEDLNSWDIAPSDNFVNNYKGWYGDAFYYGWDKLGISDNGIKIIGTHGGVSKVGYAGSVGKVELETLKGALNIGASREFAGIDVGASLFSVDGGIKIPKGEGKYWVISLENNLGAIGASANINLEDRKAKLGISYGIGTTLTVSETSSIE